MRESKLLSAKKAPPFEPRWPTIKAIRVGWLFGRGTGSAAIARVLNDGTSPESVRTQLQRAQLEEMGENKNVVYVPVRLTKYERKVLSRRAEDRKIDLAEWMRRIVVHAGIREDLYDAVVDGDEE